MSPSLPVLPGAALPAPWGLFEVLLLATFAAHLLVMNLALGGTLLALFTPGPGRGLAVGLARPLPTAVAVTVNLGVPPLLFASVLYGQYLYSAAIFSAVAWLSFFLLVMVAYGLLYRFQSRAERPGASGLALAAGLLLLAASLVMVNVASLAVTPGAWSAAGSWPEGFLLNLADPTLLPRWLHFVLASLAVAGLFLALVKARAAARGDAAAKALRGLGLAWFGRASLVQLLVGAWFLLTLPRGVARLFMGVDALATGTLLLGIVLSVAAVIAAWRRAPGLAAVCLVAAVCVMVGVRELVRRACLAPYFLPESLAVAPQYGPFVMFALSLLAVAVLVVWMVAAHRRAARG